MSARCLPASYSSVMTVSDTPGEAEQCWKMPFQAGKFADRVGCGLSQNTGPMSFEHQCDEGLVLHLPMLVA